MTSRGHFFQALTNVCIQKILIPTPKKVIRNSQGGWVISIRESMRQDWKLQGEGVRRGYKPNDHPWWRNGYFLEPHNNHGNAKFSTILSDSKSNCWILIPWNAFSWATCKDYFNQNNYGMYEKKNTKLTSFGFLLRYCTMDCLNSPCEILTPFTRFSCSDNA